MAASKAHVSQYDHDNQSRARLRSVRVGETNCFRVFYKVVQFVCQDDKKHDVDLLKIVLIQLNCRK